jgi:hypothetical protein
MEFAQQRKQAYIDLGFEEKNGILHPDNIQEEDRDLAILKRGIEFLGILT